MDTSRTSMTLPGTFEPNLRVTPSSGCTRTTSWLLPSSSVSVSANGRGGARLTTSALAATRRARAVAVGDRRGRCALDPHRDLGAPPRQPLAGAQVEGHTRPAAGLHAQ